MTPSFPGYPPLTFSHSSSPELQHLSPQSISNSVWALFPYIEQTRECPQGKDRELWVLPRVFTSFLDCSPSSFCLLLVTLLCLQVIIFLYFTKNVKLLSLGKLVWYKVLCHYLKPEISWNIFIIQIEQHPSQFSIYFIT